MKFRITVIFTVICLCVAAPALAAGLSRLKRAWVSRNGIDTGSCGAASSPCRTLDYTMNNIIATGGEIDILDPGGYGGVVINRSVSIVNDGAGTAGVLPTLATLTAAIVIAAGPTDAVTLRGLNIDGLGLVLSGIRIDSAGSVTIDKCVTRHFTGDGLLAKPATAMKLSISDSSFLDNDGAGVRSATGDDFTASLSRVQLANNKTAGLFVQQGSEVQASSKQARVMVFDSVVTGNEKGIYVYGRPNAHVDIMHSSISGNQIGLHADTFVCGDQVGGGVITVGRSLIAGNNLGASTDCAGTVYSTHDNIFQDNAIGDIQAGGSFTPLVPK